MATISVIIPHYNRSMLLEQTIESVKAQSYKDWEIIIVDDGSDSHEWNAIQQHSSAQIYIHRRIDGSKGPSRCRNIGVAKSSGKYIIFLDSDDILADFCLQQRIEEMEKDKVCDIGLFLMNEFHATPGDRQITFNLDLPLSVSIAAFLQGKTPWNVTCVIWLKTSFTKLGGFDENFLYMEDPDLHLRALIEGINIRICYDQPPDCYYRVSNHDITKQDFWFNSIFYRIKFYKKIFSKSSEEFIANYKSDIKTGIYKLAKYFLYPRINALPGLYNDLIRLMNSSKIFSSFEILRLKLIMEVGTSRSLMTRAFRLKGLCYRLLP